MASGEDEVVVLVPVLQREVRQRRGVGELEVGEVPVEDLTVAGREVDVAVASGGGEGVVGLVSAHQQ